ncbi:MAG: metal-binding protein [Methanomicrobiales archaeon]|nr:metal-binding protein [Methanomicrobiales archaeon]
MFVLGDRVQKEELLHLHMLFIHVRKYYETITQEEIPTERYDLMHISPVHIHKNKKSHKEAILVLGQEIVTHINQKPAVLNFTHEISTTNEIAVEN